MPTKQEIIDEKARSCKALKGALTRKLNVAERVCDLAVAQTDATDAVLQDLRDSLLSVKDSHAKLDASLTELQRLEPPEFFDAYETRLGEEETRKEKMVATLTPLIARYELLLRPRAPAPAPHTPATAAAPPRPNDALKPKVLTRDAKPVELTAWVERFIAYHRSSRLDKCTLLEQQAYFKAFIDAHLNSKLRSKIQNNTPVLDSATDVSCMDHLREVFLVQHPIFSRRLAFYKAKQEPGQEFSDFAAKLERQGDECDLTKVEVDETYVMRYYTACTDVKLQEEFLKIKDPTKEKMLDVVATYENGKRYSQSMREAGTARANATSSTRGKSRGSSSKGEAPAWKQLKSKLVRERRCFRCGDSLPKNDSDHKCKAIDATCKNCERQGHFAGVCFMKGSNTKDASTGAFKKKPVAKANATQEESEDEVYAARS